MIIFATDENFTTEHRIEWVEGSPFPVLASLVFRIEFQIEHEGDREPLLAVSARQEARYLIRKYGGRMLAPKPLLEIPAWYSSEARRWIEKNIFHLEEDPDDTF